MIITIILLLLCLVVMAKAFDGCIGDALLIVFGLPLCIILAFQLVGCNTEVFT